MKKITVILMLTMVMSICAFSAPKPNVHNKHLNVSSESMKKAIAKSKNKPIATNKKIKAINKDTQVRIEKQRNPVRRKLNLIH